MSKKKFIEKKIDGLEKVEGIKEIDGHGNFVVVRNSNGKLYDDQGKFIRGEPNLQNVDDASAAQHGVGSSIQYEYADNTHSTDGSDDLSDEDPLVTEPESVEEKFGEQNLRVFSKLRGKILYYDPKKSKLWIKME